MKSFLLPPILALAVLLGGSTHLGAAPAGTAISYQGQLNDNGVPANGSYEFRFILHDSPAAGVQIGSPRTNAPVAVAGGEFTTAIDFGVGAFNGEARFLEIAVRPAGSAAAFTPLTPRQGFSPVPYALRALEGSAGPQGPAGATGPQGSKGDKGDKGDPGIAGAPGSAGAQGPKGDKGDQGNAGIPGATGPQGLQGVLGPQGLVGTTGATGPAGPKGDKGDTGAQGPQGPAGAGANLTPGIGLSIVGSVISLGTNGAALNSALIFKGNSVVWETVAGTPGPKGDKGDAGAAGPVGPKGDAGAAGVQGPQGVAGIQGLKGDKGDKGDAGAAGPQGLKGDKGDPGLTGTAGVAGPAGPKGDKGDPGLTGAAGAQGPQGLKGDTGLTGATGPSGPIGPAGAPGATGPAGAKGDPGLTGAAGVAGPAGAKGDKGDLGATGPAGATGPTGAKGDAGAAGAQGSQGLKGDPGLTGATGPSGPVGPTGATGPAGAKGDKGDAGLTGAAGVAGPGGPKGDKGDAGATGAQGTQGLKGDVGATGPKGDPGLTGATGPQGTQGVPGPVGLTGAIGPQGPQGLQGLKGDQGDTGATGAVGAAGPVGPAGAKGVNWRGAWDAGTAYALGDAVANGGASWFAKAASTGVTPVAGASWDLLADKGAAGNTGPAGATGAAGATGPQGVAGPAGATGPVGPLGPIGPQGPQGSPGSADAWSRTGNAGANPTNGAFLGTADNLPLEFKVNGTRGLRLQPALFGTVHVIGGHSNNIVSAFESGTIAGGGGDGAINQVTGNYGAVGGGRGNNAGFHATVAGGENNTASGSYSMVPGGFGNTAAGLNSFAAGARAKANHNGAFVWADDDILNDFTSTANNQFLIRAAGNVGINKNNPATALDVSGTVTATSFTGDGSGLTGISAANVTSGTVPAAALDNAWKSTGNAGINPAVNFLGTTDSQPLEFKVNGTRGLRLEPAQGGTVHVIGGFGGNVVSSDLAAGTVAGGGTDGAINQVTGSHGTVGGGRGNTAGFSATVSGGNANTASGAYSMVLGGADNTAAGDGSFAAGFRAKANHHGAFVWADSSAPLNFASTAASQFLIRAAGGVGIGKNNPTTALDVAGTVTATGFTGDGSALTGVAKLGAANTFTANQTFTGNVGIGTDNPADRLHVVGQGTRARVQSTNETFAGYIAKNSVAEWFTGVGGSGGEWTLFQNSPVSASRLMVTTNGNVGIGTTPATALHVKTDAPNAGVARLDNRHPGGFAGIYFDEDNQYRGHVGYVNSQSSFGGPGTMQLGARGSLVFSADPGGFFNERMRINGSNGNVGIGRTPTANKLEVEGNASKNTAGSWLANSDRRIKQDIQTVESALDTLDRVRLVSFRYTDDYRAAHPSVTDRPYLNVIAQEFAEVFPDHVQSSGEKLPDGSEILQVDTYPLTIYSAAAVQELAAKVESGNRKAEEREATLRSELQRRDAKIAALEARLEKLERMMEAKGGEQ